MINKLDTKMKTDRYLLLVIIKTKLLVVFDHKKVGPYLSYLNNKYAPSNFAVCISINMVPLSMEKIPNSYSDILCIVQIKTN